MKKNYFLGTLMSLFMLVALPSQAASISSLYGKYKFTADMDVKDASLSEYFSNDCEVTITEGDGESAVAYINGLAGAAGRHLASDFTDNKLIISNLNTNKGPFEGGLWMTDKGGSNPWNSNPTMELAYNPETKAISVPDFSLVTVTDYTAAEGTIVVTFTNAKLELVEAAEVEEVEWEGVYKVKADVPYRMNGADETNTPAEFDMEIAWSDNAEAYMIRSFMGTDLATMNMSVKLLPTDANNVLEIEALSVVGMITVGESYYKLKDVNGQANNISLTKNSDGSISIKDFTVYVGGYGDVTNDKFAAGYNNVTATLPQPEVDWTGTYSVTASNGMGASELWPNNFEMVIEKNSNGNYWITKFIGHDVASLNDGGIVLKKTDDVNVVKITAATYLYMVGAGEVLYQLYDMNGAANDVTMTMNEDGSISINTFTVKYGTNDYAGWYQNVKATRIATSINAVEKETAKVTVNGGVINIEGGAQAVVVYDVAGRVEFSGVASSVANLAKGIHIVKVGNNVVKVNVK